MGENLLGVCKWKKCPHGVVCPCPWAINMYMTMIFEHLFLRNRLANQSQTLCGTLLGKGNKNGEGHMTKMATMAVNNKTLINHILQNWKTHNLETLPEVSVKAALQSLYNLDPQMTLTYLMARSAEVAYPRSQVSVYRTIGPLVKCT